MVADVFPTVYMLFEQVVDLFDRVFVGLGAWGFFLGGFIAFLTYRFLLVPLYGSGGASDKVRKKTSSSSLDD